MEQAVVTPSVVLVVDDDDETRETYLRELRLGGFVAEGARSGREALTLGVSDRFELAIVDQRLGDLLGTDVMERLKTSGRTLPFVLVSGWLSLEDEVEARRLGALDTIELPIFFGELGSHVARAWTRVSGSTPEPADAFLVDEYPAREAGSNVERMAIALFKGSHDKHDPRTMAFFAKSVGFGVSALNQLSRSVGISPRNARDFARVLRANRQARAHGSSVEVWFTASDATLRYLLQRGGFGAGQRATPVPTGQYLAQQTFVDADHPVVRALRRLIATR